MLKMDGDTYTIRIYDQDPISDDYGDGFTISSQTKGIGSLSLNNFDVTVNVMGNPIRDAHWGMEKTLDFYKNVLNRNSYDGNGATIYQFVNPFLPSQGLPNQSLACSEAPFCMVYGLGDGVTNRPLVSLDVMAHEFTHMVTAHNIGGGLDYNGESGALNEGFSDIFAVLAEGYTYGQFDWTIGEKYELKNQFTRSFINPKVSNPSQPNTYGKEPWKDPNSSKDHGGVHYNSGVLNYWFYLLCNGGSGTNDNQNSYNVHGVGTTKAAKIAYNTLMYGVFYTATFADAREGSIKETIKLYGKDSQEHQSVVNAWHAVGVGNKYIEPTNQITIKAKMPSDWGTTISAWTWQDGSEGHWTSLEKEGEWYSYTSTANPLNIIFVNGSTWNGDNNQTVDIRLTENSCLQIGNNTAGKRSYTVVDCPSEEFELKPGNYVIVANRDKDGDRNWYYMTSDLGTASTKRFQAVSTGTENMGAINITDLEDKYVWTLEKSGIEWKLKNGAKYVSWTSGNSATLASTARSLTLDAENNQVQVHFNDGTSERYLSLNAAANNNYFAFYGNQNQITKLFFIPYKESETPITPTECKTVPYTETFASSQGDFTIENPVLPSGFTSIWNWDSQYGMVAKSTKNNTKYKSEAWLLSPCIELLENDKCVLSFSHAAKFFSSTEQMTLYLATNYIKDAPGESEWQQLTIPNYPTGANWDWFESGEIDLSAYQGKEVVIAFRYVSDTNYAPQWEIKNFTVKQATTTAVSNTKAEESSATKILRNGQIFILRGDKTYTLQGQEVK